MNLEFNGIHHAIRGGFLLLLSLLATSISAETPLEPEKPISNTELSSVSPESPLSARQVVENFQAGLIAVMKKAKALEYSGRYEQLKSIVRESHNLEGITRIVLGGKQWKAFDIDQKQQLLDIFSRLAIATYAYNFNDYSGESFQFVVEQEAKRGKRLVRTVLTVPKGEDVRFDCVLKQKDGHWLIINIVANGVSDLALKRSEYSSILKQQGLDGLLEKMNGKIKFYADNKKSET